MKRHVIKVLGNEWSHKALILLIFVIIMGIFEPRFFLPGNIRSILLAISIYGIMSCGMLVVIITGGIDLCIGSTAALGACVLTMTYVNNGQTNGFFFIGLISAVLICLLLGLFHGILVAYLKLPPFVVTLATQYLIFGIVATITGGNYITPRPGGAYYWISNARLFDIPMPIVWFALFAAVFAFILSYTSFGKRCYFAGGNRFAAEIVGINTKRFTLISYMIASLMACIGGIVLVSLNMQVFATTASGYEGKVLTAMVVGGISLMGGKGGIPGVIFGALFVGIVNNALILLNVPSEFQTLVQGVIIIAAIAFNMLAHSQSTKTINRISGGMVSRHE